MNRSADGVANSESVPILTTVVSSEVVVDVSGIAVVCESDTVAGPVDAGVCVIVDPASVDVGAVDPGDVGVSGAVVEAVSAPPVASCVVVDPVSVDAGVGVSGAAVEAVSAPPVVYGLAS